MRQDDTTRLPRDGEPNLRLPVLTQIADVVIDTLLRGKSTIHAPTAIGGCAATAGALLVRSTYDEQQLRQLEPGSIVPVEAVGDEISLLLMLVGAYAKITGVKWLEEQEPDDIDEPHALLIARLEPVVSAVLDRNAVPVEEWPDYAAVATVDLAFRSGAQTRFAHNVRLGLNIGARTVPPVLPGR